MKHKRPQIIRIAHKSDETQYYERYIMSRGKDVLITTLRGRNCNRKDDRV